MARVAAFFDLDGPLLSTSSAVLYMKYLRRRPKGPTPFDRISLASLLKTLWYQALYNANRIDVFWVMVNKKCTEEPLPKSFGPMLQ